MGFEPGTAPDNEYRKAKLCCVCGEVFGDLHTAVIDGERLLLVAPVVHHDAPRVRPSHSLMPATYYGTGPDPLENDRPVGYVVERCLHCKRSPRVIRHDDVISRLSLTVSDVILGVDVPTATPRSLTPG